MRTTILLAALVSAGAANIGCTAGTLPGAPSLIPPPSVAAVPTLAPGVWDTRTELAAWVDNGATTGPVSLIGDGADAVIRIDFSAGEALLHGPTLASPTRRVVSARLRCRWIGAAKHDLVFVTMSLRPPNPSASHFFGGPILRPTYPSENQRPQLPLIDTSAGNWVDQDMASGVPGLPVYETEFVTILIGGGTPNVAPAAIHGVMEIDRIQLIGPQ